MEGSESRESRMRFEFSTLIFLHLLTSLNFFLSYASSSSSSSSGNSNGVCVSMDGRFPPYSNHGKPPRGVNKSPKDLTLCRMFRKKTCCDVAQTHPAFISIRTLASTGEANQDCLQLWELLECSICDPQVGVQPGPPVICASFCEKVYEACSKAYFSMDTTLQALTPCGVNDFVCGRASEWISNGTELCRAAGFAVNPFDDGKETSCYGGKARLDAIADAWTPSRYKGQRGMEYSGILKDFQHWVREMPSNEKVSWAVAGMVLTAGILFKRRRRRGQHHIQAAIQRNARLKNLDRQNVKPRSPVGQANRMGTGR